MTEAGWIRAGAIAGILYVLIGAAAGALTGAIPAAGSSAATYQAYFVEKQQLLIVQAWLFPLAAPLLLMFSVAVRRILRRSSQYLSELFVIAQTVIAALLIVTMGLQFAVAQAAEVLDAQVVFTVGTHAEAIIIELFGFLTGTAAFAYAYCVFKDGVLPRWSAFPAILASSVCVAFTVAVFIRTGPFALEGGVSAFGPAVATVLWYLSASIALLGGDRRPHQIR
jgi:hypothetical protein